jgi:hypothetical protein
MTRYYSVPEYLVGKRVTVKKYHNEVRIYAISREARDNETVAVHKRVFGSGKMQIDIYHYLNTLKKKPGAVRNSIPRLKAVFDTYYAGQRKRTAFVYKFIELFLENKELAIEEIIALFERETANKGEINALDVINELRSFQPISQIDVSARAQPANYAVLVTGGARLERSSRKNITELAVYLELCSRRETSVYP